MNIKWFVENIDTFESAEYIESLNETQLKEFELNLELYSFDNFLDNQNSIIQEKHMISFLNGKLLYT